jgi:hypothetical protein
MGTSHASTTTTDGPPATDQVIGERFARAVGAKDAPELKALLHPEVDFRAMTPAKFWESADVDEVVDETIIGTWFAPERRITDILAVQADTIGATHRVGYRFRVQRPDGEFVIEQQAYFRTTDGRISWLRIMCSGFLPLDQE